MTDEIRLLPDSLRRLSLSDREIVLAYPEVLDAMALLVSAEIGFLGWEGWALYPHGHGHYNEYPGMDMHPEPEEDWQAFVIRSCQTCMASIFQAWEKWSSEPMDERVLYFCVTGIDRASWIDRVASAKR